MLRNSRRGREVDTRGETETDAGIKIKKKGVWQKRNDIE